MVGIAPPERRAAMIDPRNAQVETGRLEGATWIALLVLLAQIAALAAAVTWLMGGFTE